MAAVTAQGILEALPLAVMVLAPNGRIRRANAEACRVLQHTRASLDRLRLQDLCTANAEPLLSQLAVVQRGAATAWPAYLCRRDNEPLWAELHIRKLADDSLIVTFHAIQTGTWIDPLPATALDGQERHLRLLVDVFPEPAWLTDGDGNVIYCNPAWYRYTGQTPATARGRGWKRALHRDDFSRVSVLARHTIPTGAYYEITYRLRRADGQYRWQRARSTAFRDTGGTIVRWFGTCVDVHEQIQTCETLERDLLRTSDQERERLGHELHDGLCQQLIGVNYCLQVLAKQLQSTTPRGAADATEISQQVSQSIRECRALMAGLLPVPSQPDGLVLALRQLANGLDSLGRIRCAFRGGATVADPAIAAHLFRIAQEATSNAFRHAQPTHVTIRLTRHTGRLRLEIRDDGVGLPAGAWQNKGRGLRSMQYRAQLIHADLTISRHRNSGTIVTCSLSAPYANRRA